MVNFSGTAGDSFSYHNGWPFTTPDEDNDFNPDVNCAFKFHGGWWFKWCHNAFLNGPYIHGPNSYSGEGIIWKAFKDLRYSLKSSQMKIRPRDFWAAEYQFLLHSTDFVLKLFRTQHTVSFSIVSDIKPNKTKGEKRNTQMTMRQRVFWVRVKFFLRSTDHVLNFSEHTKRFHSVFFVT